ncbi:MAG: PqqD family protein [Candidatus Contendobacter sp.]
MLALPAIVLRDHLVLCEGDRLRVLNPTARRLWEIQRETQDVGRAVAWLVDTYGLTVEQAKRDIAALFAPDPVAGETPTTPALRATPPCPRRGKDAANPAARLAPAIATHAYESHYRLHDRPFSLRCATADLARAIEPLFAQLRVETTAGPCLEVEASGGGFAGWRNEERLFATPTRP